MKRYLYTSFVPAEAQRQQSLQGESRRRVEKAGLLGQDTSSTTPISVEPGQQRIVGQYRGDRADIMAIELRELANAGSDDAGFAIVPYHVEPGRDEADGWVTIDQSSVGRVDPNSDLAWQYDAALSRSGTRRSEYRAIRTTQRSIDHPFGNTTTAAVAIPAVASDVWWTNPETGTTEEPSTSTSRSAEFGDVDVYDQSNSSLSNPTLVYDIDYRDESAVDVRVWDGRGNAAREDGDGVRQWQRVFTSTHDYVGRRVLSNGIVRLTFDVAGNTLSAETWDDGAGAWTDTALGTSDWELAAIDIGRRTDQQLAPNRADAVTKWADSTSLSTYTLNLTLRRGADAATFYRLEDSQSGVPSGLQDLLAPIADDVILDAQDAQTLRPRSEVNA